MIHSYLVRMNQKQNTNTVTLKFLGGNMMSFMVHHLQSNHNKDYKGREEEKKVLEKI